MTGRIVGEKVRRPEPAGLNRPRLEQRLLTAQRSSLALVVAPPGSGKSTLLAQVAALPGRRSAWYCVGPEDATAARFVRHLAHALASVTPVVDPLTESVDELLIALQGFTPPLLVVADDLHEVSGSPAEAALERFVRLRPRSVTVLLGSRRTPDINTTRLLASGELVELGIDDLRFRSWEVEELYRRVYGEPLSPESAAALTRRTEGWAAGLQLFHLSTVGRERSVRESAVADLSGRSRLIRSYLTHNVIADLPPDRREFLVSTSALGVLTGQLCDELLGATGSLAVLQDLESRHFFTTSIDDGQTFRYHEILRSHLEVLLVERLGEEAALDLYERAAKVLEFHGFGQAAVRAYARAQEWGAVARLVRDSRSGLSVDEVLSAPGCRSALSNEDPWMALSQARRLVRHGDLGAALLAYRRAEQLADDDTMLRDTEAEQAMIRLWLPSADGPPSRPVDLRHSVEVDAWLETTTASVVRRATVALLPGAAASASTALGRTLVHLLAGEFELARTALGTASGVAAPWESIALRLLRMLVGIVDDTVVDPGRQLEEICLTADVQGYAWLSQIGRDVQPWVLTPGSAPSAQRPLTTSEHEAAEARVDGNVWGGIILGIVAGVMLIRQGRAATAGSVLRDVAETAGQVNAPVIELWASALSLLAAGGVEPVDGTNGHRAAESRRLTALAASLGAVGIEVCLPRVGGIRPPSPPNNPLSREDTGRQTADSSASAAPVSEAPATATSASEAGVADPVSVFVSPAMELTCLGGLAVFADGLAVDLTRLRPRARTLLYVLSVRHGHDVHREELIDVLWRGTSLAVGAHRLHVAASSVRRLLTVAGCGPDPVRRNGDAYRLDLWGVRSDVAQFESAVKAMSRALAQRDQAGAFAFGQAALGRYSGHLLPEVGPADWVVGERERLRLLATSVAVDMARLAPRLDRLEEGRRAAQRAVELDPLRDSGWLLLAQHQEALGEPTAAAITRREHQRILDLLEPPTDPPSAPDGAVSRVLPPRHAAARERA